MKSRDKLSVFCQGQLHRMLDLMMEMNSHPNQDHAYQYIRNDQIGGTYGSLLEAVERFVRAETGRDIRNRDWNLGGNRTYLEDVLVMLDEMDAQDRLDEEYRRDVEEDNRRMLEDMETDYRADMREVPLNM